MSQLQPAGAAVDKQNAKLEPNVASCDLLALTPLHDAPTILDYQLLVNADHPQVHLWSMCCVLDGH